MTAPDVRALEEWAARAMLASYYERMGFPDPWADLPPHELARCRIDAAALAPLLAVVAAARAWSQPGIEGFAERSAVLVRAVDALERAMGERSDG